MRFGTQALCIVLGIAAPVAITLWSASDKGPRSKQHYDAVPGQATMGTRDVILAFEKMGIDGRDPAGALRRYFAEDGTEHDPNVKGDRQSVIDYLEKRGWSGEGPKRKIHRIIVDGDLGVVHHEIILKPGAPSIAAVDIFRVRGGKIVEHWDVIQEVPEKSANTNTMF